MITDTKINPLLEERDVDVVIASTGKHVFYTSGLTPSTTVTPHAENFEETGYYYDSPPSPPKAFSVWSRDQGGPYLVIPPVETTQLADSDADPVETYVYAPGEYTIAQSDGMSAGDQAVVDALDHSYDSIYDALDAALDGLVDASSTVALERMSLSPTVRETIEERLDCESVTGATELLHELRLTKTDEEIDRLRTAAELNEAAIMDSLDELEEGMTEQEFADIFKEKQCRNGARPGHTMIGFGAHSAYSHANPTERVLEEGDVIRFEVGLDYEHYPADLARTFAFRSAPEQAKKRYRVIAAAMERCEECMAAGESTTDVHNSVMDEARAVARDVGATELADWTRRHIGHNIGLDVHDHPLLSPTMSEFGDDRLREGMVMNYELAHLTLGAYGVQLEDTALVTDDGCEPFTSSPSSLPIIG